MIRSKKILRHAKGQPCALRLPGICNGNPETTVFCHLNTGGKGMGLKTHDILGFFGCADCHAAYDTIHGRSGLSEAVISAMCETWVRLVSDGIIIVPQDIQTPLMDKPIKPRKPKEQRAKIPSRGFPKRVAKDH